VLRYRLILYTVLDSLLSAMIGENIYTLAMGVYRRKTPSIEGLLSGTRMRLFPENSNKVVSALAHLRVVKKQLRGYSRWKATTEDFVWR
jgi:hypothetical protein